MDSQITINIKHPKVRAIFWNGSFLDTNKDIVVNMSDALRLARTYSIDIIAQAIPYSPEHWKEKRFGFTGDADTNSGFGNCTVNLVRYSIAKGYDIRWIGRQQEVPTMAPLQSKQVPLDLGMVWHEQPNDKWFSTPFERNIGIVPFETTKVPKSWVPKLNTLTGLLVPCKQNVEMMVSSGVRTPIEIIHWGVDENKFYPIERPDRDIFTFGHMGALSIRKGTDLLIDAFKAAFPPQIKDVRLICKTSYNMYPFMVADKRIEVLLTPYSQEELIDNFIKKIDCFVFPTRGEGFGLPPLEMMATGVPAIVTNWSGPVEYMNDEVGWPLKQYELTPAKNFSEMIYKEDCGMWAEPNFDELVNTLRYAYEHRDEVKQKGAAAAKHVQDSWLWKDKINMFHEALGKFL